MIWIKVDALRSNHIILQCKNFYEEMRLSIYIGKDTFDMIIDCIISNKIMYNSFEKFHAF